MDLLDAGQEDSFDGDIACKVARKCGLWPIREGFSRDMPIWHADMPRRGTESIGSRFLSVLHKLSWAGHVWGLRLWCVPAPSHDYYDTRRTAHARQVVRARQTRRSKVTPPG